MKKKSLIIVFILVVSLCLTVLTACNNVDYIVLDSVKDQVKRENQVNTAANTSYTVKSSTTYLNEKGKETTFNIRWTVSGNDAIQCLKSGDIYTVEIPAGMTSGSYTLKATIVDDKNKPYTDQDGNEYCIIYVCTIGSGSQGGDQGGDQGGNQGGNQGGELEGKTLTISPTTLTMNDENNSSGYGKYNGQHTINGVVVTTTDVMVNTFYGDTTQMIQCKASTGKISLSGAFSKVTLVFETTYDYSTSAFLLTKDGTDIRPTTAPSKVTTGRVQTDSKDPTKTFPIYSYTIVVNLDNSKVCSYEIGALSSEKGMRCFASIVFEA